MTDRAHKLSLTRQAELLGISRGSLYYAPVPPCEDDLRLMRRIDDVNAGSKLAHLAEVKLTHPGEEQARARGVVT